MAFLKAHPVWSVVIAIVLASVAWMWKTDTLSYPWIMLDRQVQSIRHCVFGQQAFDADPYGFRFVAPEGKCILPHRIFPDDASAQVLPRGFYFVINEYAKGTVVSASRSSLLFERASDHRDVSVVMASLSAGGFLEGATTETTTTGHDIPFTVVRHAKGIDTEKRFNWAFAMSRDGSILLSILAPDDGDDTVFDAMIESAEWR